MLQRARVATVVAVTFALLLAGCSSPPASRATGEPTLASVPIVEDFSSFVLPLDNYAPTNQQRDSLTRAENQLTASCLRRFGFQVSAPVNSASATGINARRYGVTDEATAQRYGYRSLREVQQDANQHGSPPIRPTMSAAEQAVLTGRGQNTYNGLPVPAGGCLGEAKRKLSGNVEQDQNDTSFVSKLEAQAYQSSLKDSRVVKAQAAWSACMARSGYHYTTSMDANNDPAFKGAISTQERGTAVADVRCKKETNLANIWAAVETAYQARSVQQNIDALSAIKKRLEDRVRAATAALTTGGS